MIAVVFFVAAVVATVRLGLRRGRAAVLLGLTVAIVGAVSLMWVGWKLPLSSATTRLATHVIVPFGNGGYREIVTKVEPTRFGPQPFNYLRLNYVAAGGTTRPHDLPPAATTRVGTKRGEKPHVEDIRYSSSNWLLDPIPVSRASWILHIPQDDPAPSYP